MSSLRILITGGSGLVGQYISIELSKDHDILTLYNNNPGNCTDFNHKQFAITDTNALVETFNEFKPDVVVHLSAVPNAAKADAMTPKDVYAINVSAAENVAVLCKKHSAKLIYTSTDMVYGGYRGSMLDENAKLVPISLYAETKLMAEVKIQEVLEDYVILRTALQFGFGLNHSSSHFDWMYNKLLNGEQVDLFHDQWRTPLALHDSARMINEIIQKDISSEIINFGGLERVSRFEIGEMLCENAGLDKNLLIKKYMKDVEGIYKVEDVSMSTEKLQSFGIKPKPIEETMKEVMNYKPN
jgi:dTDP-4-dehydrorhamnose reductase